MGTRTFAPLALVVTALATSGCAVDIRTAEQRSTVCEAARVGGVIAWDPAVGVGFQKQGGGTHPVVWPFGWSARMEVGGVVLLGESGDVVAREGDRILTGGSGGELADYPCGPIEILE